MDNTVTFVYKLTVYVMQLLTDDVSCRPLLWVTNDVINGADKHALSSLLLRLSQLGCNFKSCLLSRRIKPFIWRQKTRFRFPSVSGKNRGFSFSFKNRTSPRFGWNFACRQMKVEDLSKSVKQAPHSEQATGHGMHCREIMFTPRCSPRAREFPGSGRLFCMLYGCGSTGVKLAQFSDFGLCQRYMHMMRSIECPSSSNSFS